LVLLFLFASRQNAHCCAVRCMHENKWFSHKLWEFDPEVRKYSKRRTVLMSLQYGAASSIMHAAQCAR